MKSICFTNLGTVNCQEFELTNKLFFEEMSKKISMSPEIYNVSYDNEKDIYKIMFDGTIYETHYRNTALGKNSEKKDIVDGLNHLIEVSKIQLEISNKTKEENCEIKENKQNALSNAKNGIVNTNDEKRSMINFLNEEYKKDRTKVFRPTLELMKKINFWEEFGLDGEGVLVHLARILLDAIGISVCMTLMTHGYASILFIIGVSATGLDLLHGIVLSEIIDNFLNGHGGLWAIISSLVAFPFIAGFRSCKRLVEKIKHIIEVNKIKKTITDLDHEKYMKKRLSRSKVNVLEASKLLNNIVNDNNNLNVTSETINNLKNDILSIKNKIIKDKYANDLYEIIKYFIESSDNVKDKKRLYEILNNQIDDLKIKVEEELRKEKEEERINERCDSLIENIEHQKSIGAR